MAFTKITNTELNSRGATTLPNQPTISAAALKQEFDAPAKEIVAPKFNNLIDELEAETAAGNIGIETPTGRIGETIQEVLNDVSSDLENVENAIGNINHTELEDAVAKRHSHENKDVLDEFSVSEHGNLLWDDIPVGGGGSDYENLENLPQINGHQLIGNKSDNDLDLASAEDVASLTSVVGSMASDLGIAQSRIRNLQEVTTNLSNDKADKSDLGTASAKNAISVVTDSTDLVESRAVFDALVDTVGWVGGELFNRDTCTEGYSISDTGVFTESSAFMYSDLISVVKDVTYLLKFTDSLTFSHNIRVHEYDANGDWIRQVKALSVSSAGTYTLDFKTNSDAVYVRVSIPKTATNISLYHASVEESKCDNSVIAPVENGSTASQAYAVGSHAIRNGAFITWKNAKAQGETINDASDYTAGDVATQFGLYIPIANNAGFHNSIFRGKNLGSTVTTAQRNAIQAGTFEDMYIGDYWEINSVKYRIAHFDYWLNCGDGSNVCTDHHVVVVPDSTLVNKRMNAKVDNADTTAGAYVNSEMRTTNLADAKTIVNAAFGADNILGHREYMQNAVTDGYESAGAWVNADIELMSEIMVYGSNIFHNVKCGTALPNLYTVNKTQLALFGLDPSYIICKNVAQTGRSYWWLRDVVSATYFANISDHGLAANAGASNSLGVRPAFGIK